MHKLILGSIIYGLCLLLLGVSIGYAYNEEWLLGLLYLVAADSWFDVAIKYIIEESNSQP